MNLSLNHFIGVLDGNVRASRQVNVLIDPTLGATPSVRTSRFLASTFAGNPGHTEKCNRATANGALHHLWPSPLLRRCCLSRYLPVLPPLHLEHVRIGHLRRELASALDVLVHDLWIESAAYHNNSEQQVVFAKVLSYSNHWKDPKGSSPAPTNKESSQHSVAIVIAGVLRGVIAMVMLSNLLICFIKRKRGAKPPAVNHASGDTSETFDLNPEDYPSHLFPFDDLKSSTRNFSKGNKIGEGAFGAVYKGALRDGSEVAVKELPLNIRQGNQEFLNEVQLITGLQHKNLVKLCGCAISGSNRLLVYEYVYNKSLAQALFDSGRALLLEWPFRYNIALGLAKGLSFLHSRGPERLAHGDIKSNNVLLDKSLEPKIADFGLARMCQNNERKVLTRIEGKRGYVAPEFALHGQLTSKTDVFSFGIIVLELVSGRESMKSQLPPDQQYLLLWAWNLYEQGRAMELVDPRVRDGCDEEQARLLIKVALLCSQGDSSRRPYMTRVVALLAGDADASDVPERPAFLGIGVADPDMPVSRPNSITTWK